MSKYSKISVDVAKRIELHDKLLLTGAEVSINIIPKGEHIPFIHFHKQNEEIYGILSGSGWAIIDEDKIKLEQGDWLRISPSAKRQFFASDNSDLSYVCIQVRENSLEAFTFDDAVIRGFNG